MSEWRSAVAADDEAIVSMCLALNAEDPGDKPVHPNQVRRTLETLRNEPLRGCAVVLDIDGVLCGYALLISFWSNEVGGELCTLDELFIVEGVRGKGHGTELIERLARGDALWARTAVAVALEVTPANQRAMRLYQRLGFTGGNRVMRRRID